MKVQVYRDAGGFDALASEWNELLHRSASDTVFLTLEFQRTWWTHLGEGNLLLVAIRDNDGTLAGIGPLFSGLDGEGRRVLQCIGCVEVSDYLDLIATQGREEEVHAALLDSLVGMDAPVWDRIDLCNIHQDSPTLQVLPRLAEARGYTVLTEVQEVCPVVPLPDTWEAYLELLDRKQRHEVRRKLRRAEALPDLHWYIVEEEHDLAAETEAFMELMRQSSPDKAGFMTEQMAGFFHDLAQVTFEAGWLQLAFLAVGEQRAAAYFNFNYRNRILVYNSGLDPQAFTWLSAGIVLTAYCIRYAIEQGCQVFDFMRGREPYKYRFGGQDVEVWRLVVSR